MSTLPETMHQFAEKFYLTPFMAAEIECYVPLADSSGEAMNSFWGQVEKAFRHEGLPILRIEKERGLHQFEIITRVMMPEQLVYTLQSIRDTIHKYARRNSLVAYFDAKPFADRPSSGLHLHLHLADSEGLNAYHKPPDWISDALRFSLGGLLATLGNSMPIFFPRPEDYARLDDADHVPKIFGWGVNNRYCALRIPAHPDPFDKRIEHRVPCANVDPALAVEAMLAGVLLGLTERIEPPAQEYGKRGAGGMELLEGIANYRLQPAASVETKVLNEDTSALVW